MWCTPNCRADSAQSRGGRGARFVTHTRSANILRRVKGLELHTLLLTLAGDKRFLHRTPILSPTISEHLPFATFQGCLGEPATTILHRCCCIKSEVANSCFKESALFRRSFRLSDYSQAPTGDGIFQRRRKRCVVLLTRVTP